MKTRTLQKELRSAGATSDEIGGLVALAATVGQLGQTTPATLPRKRHAWWLIAVPVGVAGLAVGMAMIVAAQAVLPGSWLYPVQKASNNIAIATHPEYRAEVMMHRAQQVRQLVTAHADSNVVLATLSDYQIEAAAYKSSAANYAAFEYCKTNLQQAAASASSPEREAINSTLASLNNV